MAGDGGGELAAAGEAELLVELAGGGEGEEVAGLAAEEGGGAGEEAEVGVVVEDGLELGEDLGVGLLDRGHARAAELLSELLAALAVEEGEDRRSRGR